MLITDLPLPEFFKKEYASYNTLTPIQEKAVHAGLLNNKSLLICAPTASGKTLIATIDICNTLGKGKTLYLVPLKALANEKFKEYRHLLQDTPYKVTISMSDIDSESGYLAKYDLIILTTEKLDSLLRHKVSWLNEVRTVIVDEIHLLNDPGRGPTLEIILTLLQTLIQPQLIGLSATIGNPQELAHWLNAILVQDSWRPIELKQGIYIQNKTEFYTTN
ncbi:DEAD/DEAH box helicase [Candidatus Woesearchaeota archaeon]|nr:DEAD/DEAH box helicase [Candidatus Woesearchaeota archaeon]